MMHLLYLSLVVCYHYLSLTVNMADQQYQLPSRKYLSTKLLPLQLKQDLVRLLQTADRICVPGPLIFA